MVKTNKVSRKKLVENIDFLFQEAAAWEGNKHPDDMDDYRINCEQSRDCLMKCVADRERLLSSCRKFMAVRANYGGGFDAPFDDDESFGDVMIQMESAIKKALS